MGTNDSSDPKYRRETNRRVIIYRKTRNGLEGVQFVIFQDGTTKLLDTPEHVKRFDQIAGIKLSSFPIVGEEDY